jgi:hypothetical protein
MAEWLTQGIDKSNKAEEDEGNFDVMVRKLGDEREMEKGETKNLEHEIKYKQQWAVATVLSQKQIILLSHKFILSTPHIS